MGLPAGRALAQLLKIDGHPFFHHLTRRPSFHRTRILTRDAASGLNPCEHPEPVKLRSCERGDGRKGCNQSHSVEGWITHPKCNSLNEIYFKRWGIEVEYLKLKDRIGLNRFQSKKPDLIMIEVASRILFHDICTVLSCIIEPDTKRPESRRI